MKKFEEGGGGNSFSVEGCYFIKRVRVAGLSTKVDFTLSKNDLGGIKEKFLAN